MRFSERQIPNLPAEHLTNPPHPTTSDRRHWFLQTSAILAVLAQTTISTDAQDAPPRASSATKQKPAVTRPSAITADEDREIAAVQAKAKGAGLGQFHSNRTGHFLAIGDAPESFRREALDICEKLIPAFLGDFTKRGFILEPPARRLTVVILKDAQSYAWYNGDAELPTAEGGHYDLDTNRLVVFDFRPRNADVEADAQRANLLSLVHEATHLLCFNTGLLSRNSDYPACISEGLATYGELWRRSDKTKFGLNNPLRLNVAKQAGEWIPIAKLLTNDELFTTESTEQLAYAESWLLVHYLLRADNAPRFRNYLAKLSSSTDPTKRQQLAEAALGPLSKLDKPIKTYASKLKSR